MQTSEQIKAGLQNLSPRDVIMAVEGTDVLYSREEDVLLSQIVVDSDLIDHKHALNMAHLLHAKRGQTQTVLLYSKLENGLIVTRILDGYHRIIGLKEISENPDEKIRAHVYYNCSEAEAYLQRIIAANNVGSVKFARMGLLTRGAWQETAWKDRLTVVQAFYLANFDSSGGDYGVSREEATAVKNWANLIAESWHTTPGTMYQNLRIIEVADEKLVARVRSGAFGKGQLAITAAQLGSIAFAYPHQYDIQHMLANYANHNGLSTKKIEVLVQQLHRLGADTPENVQEVLGREDLTAFFAQKTKRARHGNGHLTREAAGEIRALKFENIILREDYERIVESMNQLRRQLDESHGSFWWQDIPDLPQNERTILEAIFAKNMDIGDIAEQANVLDTKVMSLLRSAITRYKLHRQSQVLYQHPKE